MTAVYATVGSSRIEEAVAFYGELLPTIGLNKLFDNPDGGVFFGTPGGPLFAVVLPHNKQAASVGNGAMVGFSVADPAAVDAFHAKALELGGTCDGPPGYRGPEAMSAYFAYMRDLDGNKLYVYNRKMDG